MMRVTLTLLQLARRERLRLEAPDELVTRSDSPRGRIFTATDRRRSLVRGAIRGGRRRRRSGVEGGICGERGSDALVDSLLFDEDGGGRLGLVRGRRRSRFEDPGRRAAVAARYAVRAARHEQARRRDP